MKLYPSNNFNDRLFYTLIILHFIGVMLFLALGIGDLSVKKNLKTFGSRGIYLYLVFWITVFLWLFYRRERFLRKWALGVLVLLISGGIGILFHTNQRPNPIVFWSEDTFSPITYTKLKDFHASVKFREFSPEFLKLLKDAENGNAKAFLRLYLWKDVSLKMQVAVEEEKLQPINSNNFILSSKDIKKFLHSHELMLTPFNSQICKKDCVAQLMVRDTQSIPNSREDFFIYEGQKYFPSKDHAFMVVFYFESIDGLPLALFY